MPAENLHQQWFESIWELREEVVYRGFFGDIGNTISPIPSKLFAGLGQPKPDPRYLFHGVFECQPGAQRNHWVYVTSGMSNPWGDAPETANPDGPSGLGFELLIQTPKQSPWATQVLHWLMAVQLLVAAGDLKGDLVQYFDRVPLRAAIDAGDSQLRNMLIAEPEGIPPGFALPSGKVALLLCVGMTDREADFARTQGGPEAISLLQRAGAFPVTDAARASVV